MNSNSFHQYREQREDGSLKAIFSRYLSEDGTNWIMHGKFMSFHSNGEMAASGEYTHNIKDGFWTNWYADGGIASCGTYRDGEKADDWEYFDE